MGMWSRVVGLEDAVHTVHSVHISDDTNDVIRNVKKTKQQQLLQQFAACLRRVVTSPTTRGRHLHPLHTHTHTPAASSDENPLTKTEILGDKAVILDLNILIYKTC